MALRPRLATGVLFRGGRPGERGQPRVKVRRTARVASTILLAQWHCVPGSPAKGLRATGPDLPARPRSACERPLSCATADSRVAAGHHSRVTTMHREPRADPVALREQTAAPGESESAGADEGVSDAAHILRSVSPVAMDREHAAAHLSRLLTNGQHGLLERP